ncbi:unnamed protein product [Commensalibacter communis]|uniref:Uncharacterized protein n=1 Tax=Commensalibacter communis TaxID=2972786 RepID=A0A9W4TN50_9PROT|nr:hypothetical protein [Commensalibacter communis]CAI3927313.1 unnamed protein product [Commensalibacter communis]CAI3928821.1 unnamed protein product [Commensalibacter communis]CAI3933684.1 unnamed protein product [Commensalibacter communis]CAI3934204.1 unnamed protein product [Commensalibacter communis]
MRGGYREGSGRKKGSTHKVSLSTVQGIMQKEEFQSPLEIILKIMNQAYENEDYKLALEAAKGAAPYMHARLNEVNANIHHMKRIQEMSDDELHYFINKN